MTPHTGPADTFTEAETMAAALYQKYFVLKGLRDLNYRCDFVLSHILLKHSIRLDYHPFRSDSFCGMLVIDADETTIVLNKLHPQERRNFTLAHELGHYFLHRHESSKFVDLSEDLSGQHDSEIEQQANAFAAAVLLPSRPLSLMLSYRYNFYRIAKTVQASYECLKWRLVSFLMQKHSLSRSDSIALVGDYIFASKIRQPASSNFFRFLFPGAALYAVSNGYLIEVSRDDGSPIDYHELKPTQNNDDPADFYATYGI